MTTNVQKFNLAQGGKNYILTSQIEGEFIKLTCVESQVQNPLIYIGLFSLVQLLLHDHELLLQHLHEFPLFFH